MTRSNRFNFGRTVLFGVLSWSLALYSDAEATLSAGAVSAEIKQTQAEECSSRSVHCGAAPQRRL